MALTRSWMFVPGHSAKMVEKAMGTDVDVAIFDLEDGVVAGLKADARLIIAAALKKPQHGGPSKYVRVNAPGSADLLDDLSAVVVPGILGLVVPKVETTDQIDDIAHQLDGRELTSGIERGSIRLVLAIETAKGLLASPALAARHPRVAGLMFGSEDFSRDLGLPAVRNSLARAFVHVRSSLAVAAAAARIFAIDGLWTDLNDLDGLRQDCELARALGMNGKAMIHPAQIAVINEMFSPSPEQIEHASQLISEFERASAAGQGSINFRGAMVDKPIYDRALATIDLARRAGMASN